MRDIINEITNIPADDKAYDIADMLTDQMTIVTGEVPPKKKTSELLGAATGFVYACVSAIADEIGAIDLKLFELKNNGDDAEEIKDSEIINTIYRANNFTTKFDLMWLSSQYLELCGEAPWLVTPTTDAGLIANGSQPIIVLLRPDRLEVVPGEGDQIIEGYKYRVGANQKVDLKAHEVVFLRQPDPVNQFRGKGTLQAAARTADIEEYSEEWNKKFFFNSARPDSILTTENKLSRNVRENLETKFKYKYQGLGNAHKTLILERGLKWQPMALSQKDMDFIEQQKFSRDKILSIFRVPKSVIAISDDVNRANAEAGNYIFALRKIRPAMIRIVEQLNEFFVPLFDPSGKYFLDFDDPVQENWEAKVNYYNSGLQNGWLAVNEVRQLEGYDPVEGGDEPRLPFSLTPMSQGLTNRGLHKTIFVKAQRRYLRHLKAEQIKKNVKKQIVKSIGKRLQPIIEAELRIKNDKKKDQTNDKSPACRRDNEEHGDCVSRKVPELVREGYSQEQAVAIAERLCRTACSDKQTINRREWAEKYHTQFLKVHQGYENELRARQVKIFKQQRDEVIGKLPAKALDIGKLLLDVERWAKTTVTYYAPVLAGVIKDQSKLAFALVGQDDVLDTDNKLVREYLEKRPLRVGKEMGLTTNDQLRKTIAEGLAQTEGIPQIAKRIENLFNNISKYRATQAARTEVTAASNWAAEEAYKRSGVVEYKQWLTARDELVCEFCAPMDFLNGGGTIALGQNFWDRGATQTGQNGGSLNFGFGAVKGPPLHVNCRCTLIPVTKI